MGVKLVLKAVPLPVIEAADAAPDQLRGKNARARSSSQRSGSRRSSRSASMQGASARSGSSALQSASGARRQIRPSWRPRSQATSGPARSCRQRLGHSPSHRSATSIPRECGISSGAIPASTWGGRTSRRAATTSAQVQSQRPPSAPSIRAAPAQDYPRRDKKTQGAPSSQSHQRLAKASQTGQRRPKLRTLLTATKRKTEAPSAPRHRRISHVHHQPGINPPSRNRPPFHPPQSSRHPR